MVSLSRLILRSFMSLLWEIARFKKKVKNSVFFMLLFAVHLDSSFRLSVLPTVSPILRAIPRFPFAADFSSPCRQLFPIRPLKEVTSGCTSGSIRLERLGMVDCQRRDRIGPAAGLLDHAKRISVIDHHADKESDVGEKGGAWTLCIDRCV